MKKTIALLLSVALVFVSGIPFVFADSNPPWQELEGSGTVISQTSDGVYSAESTKASRIITTDAYDVRETQITFRANPEVATREDGWYTIGVAGETGEVGGFGSGDNRLDIVMHYAPASWFYSFYNGGSHADYYAGSNGTLDYAPYDKMHTFGFVKKGTNWYPTVDDKVLEYATDAKLNELLDGNEKVRFIIGANGSYQFEDIKIVEKQLWQELEGSETTITRTGDDVYSAKSADWSRIITTDAYDVRETQITFRANPEATPNDEGWYTIAVAGENKEIGGFGSDNNRLDIIMHYAPASWLRTHHNDGTTADYFAGSGGTLDYGKYDTTHTFGFVKKGENWYPTIDGKALEYATDAKLNELLDGNEKVRFIIGASGSYQFDDIKIVEKQLWQHLEGSGTAISQTEDGVYSAESANWSRIITTNAYDVRKTQITFRANPEATPNDEGWYTIAVAGETGGIGGFGSDNNRLDIIMHYAPASWLRTVHNDGTTSDYFAGSGGTLNYGKYDTTHTFGFVKKGTNWYPTIDDDVLEYATDTKLNELLDSNKKVYFIIGASGSYQFNDIKIVEKKQLWQHLEGPSETTISQTEDGVYSAESADWSRIITTGAYDVRKTQITFRANPEATPNDEGWYTIAVAGENKEIGGFGSDNNRLDIIMHYAPASWLRTVHNDGTTSDYFAGSGGTLNYGKYDTTHTFGFVKKGENWYPTIDDDVLEYATDAKLNALLDSNEKVYFIIGASGSYQFDDIKIVEEKQPWVVKSGNGTIECTKDGICSVSEYRGSIITSEAYDITQKDMSFNISELEGDWIRFGVVAADSDETARSVNAASQELIARLGQKFYISYFLGTGEDPITARKYDFNTRHTFGVRKLDGHWYPAVDGEILNDKLNDAFDSFIEANKDKGMRFTIGSQVSFSATDIAIIDSVASSVKQPEGWDYYGLDSTGATYGELEGNEQDGYELSVPEGWSFAYSNAKHDLSKTSVSFNLEDVGEWLYFAVSTKEAITRPEPMPNKDLEMPDHCVFILRPIDSHDKVVVGYWSPNHDGVEVPIRTVMTDWYSDHTIDIRQVGENWFICLDGRIIQTKSSPVFNSFMKANEGQPLHYVIGSLSPGLTLHNIKVIDQVPLAAEDETVYEDGTLDEDYGFDFSGDKNNDNDNDNDEWKQPSDDSNDDSQTEIITGPEDPDSDDSSDEVPPENQKVLARVKKRKLVSAGHGWIFTELEIAAMVAAGVIVLAGIAVSTVFIVRTVKKKKGQETSE